MEYGVTIELDETRRIEEVIAEIARAAINTALDRRMKTGKIRLSLEIDGEFDAAENIPSIVRFMRRKDSLALVLKPRGSTYVDSSGVQFSI